MRGACGDERERGEGAREVEGDEIKTPEVSTKTVSSCDSPQLPGKVTEKTQMEALIGFLTISNINTFRHNRV